MAGEARRWIEEGKTDLVIRFADVLVEGDAGREVLRRAVAQMKDIRSVSELLHNKRAILVLSEGKEILKLAAEALVYFETPTSGLAHRLQSSTILKHGGELVTSMAQERSRLGYPAMMFSSALREVLSENEWRSALEAEISTRMKESAENTMKWLQQPSNLHVYAQLYPSRGAEMLAQVLASQKGSASLLDHMALIKTLYPEQWKGKLKNAYDKIISKDRAAWIDKAGLIRCSAFLREILDDKEWQRFLVWLGAQGVQKDFCFEILAEYAQLHPLESESGWRMIVEGKAKKMESEGQWANLLSLSDLLAIHLPRQTWEPLVAQAEIRIREMSEGELLDQYHPQAFNVGQRVEMLSHCEKCISFSVRDRCLASINLLNELHDSPDAVRFSSVNNLGFWQFYDLLAMGSDEAYTSTYNGLFTRMLQALRREGVDGLMLFRTARNKYFRQMVSRAAQYNRLQELLQTLPEASAHLMLERFIEDLDQEMDTLGEAVAVADLLGVFDDDKILALLKAKVKTEYERTLRAENKRGQVVYGLLAGLMARKATPEETWLHEISSKYPILQTDILRIADLEDGKDGACIARFFFYNDEDGKSTQNTFIRAYAGDPAWTVKNKESFYEIKSSNGKVELYANKYDRKESGNEAINARIGDRKIGIFVHRGHSYYAHNTVARITENTKLVFLGSCGGYNHLLPVLHASPKAQILATKGKGTALINEPLIKDLLAEIVSGKKEILWPEFWGRISKKYGRYGTDFLNYVPPNRNFSVVFIKAYRDLAGDKKPWVIPWRRYIKWVPWILGIGLGAAFYRRRLLKRDKEELFAYKKKNKDRPYFN